MPWAKGGWQEGRGDALSAVSGEAVTPLLSKIWVLQEPPQGWLAAPGEPGVPVPLRR